MRTFSIIVALSLSINFVQAEGVSQWQYISGISDSVDVGSILAKAKTDRLTLQEFLALIPPRYSKATVAVKSNDRKTRIGRRPRTGARWIGEVERRNSKFVPREFRKVTFQAVGERGVREISEIESPVITQSMSVSYSYSHPIILEEADEVELAPLLAVYQTTRYLVNLGSVREFFGRHDVSLKDLITLIDPPTSPVTLHIVFGQPRHDGMFVKAEKADNGWHGELERQINWGRPIHLLHRNNQLSEQDGAEQPATALESKPEGKKKLKPESEGRSR